MPAGSLPGKFVAFAWFLAVATPIAAQADLDLRQSPIRVYQYDDGDFERYIYLRDPETGRLPYQTEFAQRFRLPQGGTVKYVEVCVQKPRDALPEDDLLVFIVRIYSDAGNVPGETVLNDVSQFSWFTHVPAGYRVCHEVPVDAPGGFKVNAGPVWVGVAWGDDPAVEQNLQELAVDEDNSGGRRAFRVIHEEGEAWQAWQADTDSRVYAIRLAVDHSGASHDPDPEPDPDPTPGPLPDPPQGFGYTDCVPEDTPLVFDGGYSVRMCYETPAGEVGEGKGGLWASGESGLLWFFSRDNAEVLIKVLNGCFYNNHRWVYVAPVTDLAFNLYVTDSEGRTWSHHNRQGETASTRSDNEAFPCGDQN
ncbi:MAG: hypothetical protein F4060_16055 [Holophagales bacterium]|nr:hypothetical protein [Holophagales bacterium]MYG30396.1 hypothetical protein [Holophagales bacterium]MYI81442.1 hypothetical protein [Holophagales bacterium]